LSAGLGVNRSGTCGVRIGQLPSFDFSQYELVDGRDQARGDFGYTARSR